MKAIQVGAYGGPDVLKLVDLPEPSPAPGEVLVRVKGAGVNPVDVYFREGSTAKLPLPFTPGRDAAGIVEKVGSEVKGIEPGARVYVAADGGTYGEMIVVPARQVHPLPERLSFSQGAGVGVPYGTAYRALFMRLGARPGHTVLVHGATGGVGIAAVQLARAHGLTVIGTGGTEEGRHLAMEQGAEHMLDHHDPDYLRKLMEITGGRGVDLIVEMAAHINLGKDLTVLARRGRVAVVGSRGAVEVTPRDAMGREAEIMGVTLASATDDD